MTKQDRLSLIRSRAAVICRAALPGILAVSAQEIRDTVALVLRESNDLTQQDPEETGFTPGLASVFDRVREREREEEILLNRTERDQLAKDLREYRKRRLWLAITA